MTGYKIHTGDSLEVLRTLPAESVNCCVTSPPYWGLRDYGVDGQIGLENTPEAYTSRLVDVFREVRRVLRDDGTLWLNLGDSYASTTGVKTNHPQQSRNGRRGVVGPRDKHPSASRANLSAFKDFDSLKPKDLVGIPWRVAFELQADGWYLRSDIIWHKPNPMPESVTDRPTKSHEHMFLLSKSARYWYDADAVAEAAIYAGANAERVNAGKTEQETDGPRFRTRPHGRTCGYPEKRNLRDVWTIPTYAFPDAHFATFPPALVEPCIKAGCPVGGTVIDPFAGACTTLLVARRLGRESIGIELNPEYAAMARTRMAGDRKHAPLFDATQES